MKIQEFNAVCEQKLFVQGVAQALAFIAANYDGLDTAQFIAQDLGYSKEDFIKFGACKSDVDLIYPPNKEEDE
jgi:hypothetical protein